MGADPFTKKKDRRPWPMVLAFFEQLEPELKDYLEPTRYQECWRGFNSHFHDDWRRQGDVVLWCLT
jgi:phosphatidylinositol glycan class B